MYNLTQKKGQGWPTQGAAMAVESDSYRTLSQWYHRNKHKSVTGVFQDVVGLQILPRRSWPQNVTQFFHVTHKLIFIYSNEKSTAFLGRGIGGDRLGGEGEVSPGSRQAANWAAKHKFKWKISVSSLKKNCLAKYKQPPPPPKKKVIF